MDLQIRKAKIKNGFNISFSVKESGMRAHIPKIGNESICCALRQTKQIAGMWSTRLGAVFFLPNSEVNKFGFLYFSS